MAEGEPLATRVSQDIAADVDEYVAKHGCETRSEAVKQLVEVGLRESRGPILIRWRENALNSTFYITLAAVFMVVLGISPGVVEYDVGLQVAAVLLAMAACIVACVELARTVRGQNEIGVKFGGWL